MMNDSDAFFVSIWRAGPLIHPMAPRNYSPAQHFSAAVRELCASGRATA